MEVPQKAHRQHKKGIDKDESRRKREDARMSIRKSKKEENLMKKRRDASKQGLSMRQDSNVQSSSVAERLKALPENIQKVNAQDFETMLEGTIWFRKILSIENGPPIDEIIASGVVPRLVQFLTATDQPKLQFEAAWAITNIASGTSEHTCYIHEAGAVPTLIQLLSSPNEDVCEQAVWALGNVAGDSTDLRDYLLGLNILAPLLSIVGNPNARVSMLRNATWVLSNLCRGKPQPDFNTISTAIPYLAHLIQNNDDEILTDACWALSYLSDGDNQQIQAVCNANVLPKLVQLLGHQSPTVQTPALRTVGNMVTGDDRQTQYVVEFPDALNNIHQLMFHQKKTIRKEACWTISNITAGTTEQITAVFQADILPKLIELCSHADWDVKKEAAWAISNATSGGAKEHIDFVVESGALKPLCDLLSVQDTKIILVALEALDNILKAGESEDDDNSYSIAIEEAEGIDNLERLQEHEDEQIYEKAVELLENFFGCEESSDDEDLEPEIVNENNYEFGMQQNNSQQFFDFSNVGSTSVEPLN